MSDVKEESSGAKLQLLQSLITCRYKFMEAHEMTAKHSRLLLTLTQPFRTRLGSDRSDGPPVSQSQCGHDLSQPHASPLMARTCLTSGII